jgi:hypothetical protein
MSLNSIATGGGSIREYAREERFINNAALISEVEHLFNMGDSYLRLQFALRRRQEMCASYFESHISPRYATAVHALCSFKHMPDEYFGYIRVGLIVWST